MMQTIKAQFHHPTGWLGHLVGRLMTIINRERVEWAVDKLNVQATDEILEIGFGSGLGIQALAKRASHVSGIDISAVMVQQARKRNAQAIRHSQVDIQQGVAEDIPFSENKFDKILTINVYHHWDDKALGLSECLRVLKADGTLAIVEQPPFGIEEHSQIIARAESIKAELEAAGFRQVQYITENLSRGWAAFVTGQK